MVICFPQIRNIPSAYNKPLTGFGFFTAAKYGTRCPAHEYGTPPSVSCHIHAPGISIVPYVAETLTEVNLSICAMNPGREFLIPCMSNPVRHILDITSCTSYRACHIMYVIYSHRIRHVCHVQLCMSNIDQQPAADPDCLGPAPYLHL